MENLSPTASERNQRAANQAVANPKPPTRWSGRPRQTVSLYSTGRALRRSIDQLVENERARTRRQVLAQAAAQQTRTYARHLVVAAGVGVAAMGSGALATFGLTAFMSRQDASLVVGSVLLVAAAAVLLVAKSTAIRGLARSIVTRVRKTLAHVSAAMGQSRWTLRAHGLITQLRQTEVRLAKSVLLAIRHEANKARGSYRSQKW